jgi:hypothetical protein
MVIWPEETIHCATCANFNARRRGTIAWVFPWIERLTYLFILIKKNKNFLVKFWRTTSLPIYIYIYIYIYINCINYYSCLLPFGSVRDLLIQSRGYMKAYINYSHSLIELFTIYYLYMQIWMRLAKPLSVYVDAYIKFKVCGCSY